MAMPKIGVIGTPGVANPTVCPCGNLASIVMTRTLIVPTAKMRKRMKRLKMTSSAITMRISNTTEKEKIITSLNTYFDVFAYQ